MSPSAVDHSVAWDSTMCSHYSVEAGVRRLMMKAFSEALQPNHQKQLLEEFTANPKLVYHVGLTPERVRIFYTKKVNLVSP